MSGSRSGLLTFAISLLLATLLGRRASRRFVSAILVTAAALYAANRLGYATALERLLDGNSSVRVSDTARSARAALALQDIRDQPIAGVGFSAAPQAHSLYLEIARSGGLMMLALYLIMAGGAVLAGWRRRTDDLMVASTASLVAFFAVAVQHNTLTERLIFVPLGFLLAASVHATKQNELPSSVAATVDPRSPAPAISLR